MCATVSGAPRDASSNLESSMRWKLNHTSNSPRMARQVVVCEPGDAMHDNVERPSSTPDP